MVETAMNEQRGWGGGERAEMGQVKCSVTAWLNDETCIHAETQVFIPGQAHIAVFFHSFGLQQDSLVEGDTGRGACKSKGKTIDESVQEVLLTCCKAGAWLKHEPSSRLHVLLVVLWKPLRTVP